MRGALLKLVAMIRTLYFLLTTLRLIDRVLVPYINQVKSDLKLPNDQKALLIWDAFNDQNTPRVKDRLVEIGILTVMVPKNLTRLLQPLDVTTNGRVKKMERKEFSNYFTSMITREMLADPNRDVTTIKVDMKLSTLTPLHENMSFLQECRWTGGDQTWFPCYRHYWCSTRSSTG